MKKFLSNWFTIKIYSFIKRFKSIANWEKCIRKNYLCLEWHWAENLWIKNETSDRTKLETKLYMTNVTILIPTYNQPEYIEQCVESALARDYSNLEVNISDDSKND